MRNILQDVVKKFIFLSKYTHRFLIGQCHDTVCLACDDRNKGRHFQTNLSNAVVNSVV